MRRLPILISVGIVIVAAVSFWFYKGRRLAYLTHRDFRLVAVATQALTDSLETVHADREVFSVERSGPSITVRTVAPVGREFSTDCPRGRAPECDAHYTATVTVDQALGEVPERGGFEGIAVFDAEGHFVTRRDFVRGSPPLLALPGDGGAAAKEAHRDAGNDGPVPKPYTTGAWTDVLDLGGEPHRLFCRPLALPGSRPDTLVFCAVMTEAAFQAEARATSPFVLGLFAVALLLALLAQPIVRLVLLAPRARVAFADVFTIGVCTFVMLVVLTITVLTAGLESQLRSDEDARLAALGKTIGENVQSEIGRVVRQVQDLDRRLPDLPRASPFPGRAPLPLVGTLPAACANGCDYPYLERVFWGDRDGWEVARWTVTDPEGPAVSLRTRPYFKEIVGGGGWRLEGVDGRCYLQTVRMRTSAQKAVVVSLRSVAAEDPRTVAETRGFSPVMVAGLTKLVSTWQPVLPADTGFAVIDDTGRVILHNRPVEVLSHNLFAETDENDTLVAQVRARGQAALDARYWGEPHRFWVAPLWPGSPLTLAVFRPYAALRAVAVEVAEEAALASAVYLALAFLVSVSFFVLRGPNMSWLWPMPERTSIYTGLCATYAVLGLGFTFALARWHDEGCLVAGVLLPIVALGLTAVLFSGSRAHDSRQHLAIAVGAAMASLLLAWAQKSLYAVPALMVAVLIASAVAWWRSLPDAHRRKQHGRARVESWIRALHLQRYEARVLLPYGVACVSFWALFTVLPTLAIVKGAAERAVRRLARYEVLAYAGAREARDRTIREQYRDGYGDAWPEAVVKKRLDASLDVYPPSSIREREPPESPAEKATPADDLYRKIADALDRKWVLSSFGRDLRALGGATAGGGRWVGGDGGEYYRGKGPKALFVDEPSLGHLIGFPIYVGLGFMLVGPLAYWVAWSARHIFLGAIGNPCRRTIADVLRDGPTHAYCVLPSRSTWRRALGQAGIELIDPDDPRSEGRLPAPNPVAIDALPNATARDWERRRRTHVLERALRGEHCVMVFATTPPLVAGGSAPAALADVEWLTMLGRFSLVWLRTPPLEQDRADEEASRLGAETPETCAFLAEEIHASPELALACARLPKGSFAEFRHEDLVVHLARLAAPAYAELWSACVPEEKLTLLQVAQEGVVNPARTEAVRSLLNKGLLRRRPELVVMNASFRRFLATVPDRAEVLALESARTDAFSWDDVRLPMLTAGAVAAFVVFSTERQVFDSTLLFVSTVGATALPAITRVVSSLGARMASGSSSDTATPA